MEKYKIMIAPRAVNELNLIYDYIANSKLAPENAKKQVERIKKSILSLDTFPQSHQKRNIGKYSEKSYRQLIVDNYIVIFEIDKKEKFVHVVTIQYQGRNF